MRSLQWGLPNDYLTDQNIMRPCDQCEEKTGQYGGCYAKMYDRYLCFDCYNEIFDPPTPTSLKKKARWDI